MANDVKLQNNNGFQGGESNDRISSLPDSLIQHILSFLPTKYVVPTAILSKQWKSLWTGVPSLDFEESRYLYSFGRFENFVDKVLLLRDGSSIQQFRLSLSYSEFFRYSFVQSLIAVAISHKLQQLDITVCDRHQCTLPCSIFDCQTLSMLKLSMKCTLELPSRIALPCLKVLQLSCFAFPNASSIENLFSSCPVLEELTLKRCRLIHQNSINISIPSLKSLTMVDSFENYDLVDDPKSSCYIKLEAPSLRSLSINYDGFLTNKLYLSKMSSIHKFKLSLLNMVPSLKSCIQSAIAGAISHKLQMLDLVIHLCDENPFPLPYSIFDCQSLIILKLSMDNFTLELPDHISLPSLKVMHLHYLAFQNAKSTEKMFSCCPVLEELDLQECKWIDLDSITISIPSLKILTIDDSIPEYGNNCYIRIEAPALLSFNYITDCLANHLYLTDMSSSSSSSIKACIHITGQCFYRREEKACRLVKLLQGLENMVSLTISGETAKHVQLLMICYDFDVQVLSLTHPVSDLFPVFHRLEYLDLSMEVDGDFFEWLLKFMNFMPNLGTIQFSEGVGYTINKAGLRHMPKPLLPKCFLSSLKILGLGNVRGTYHEIFFLKNFLERALSLQRINIFRGRYISRHEHQPFRDEMEKLSTRFKHCAIIIQ